MNNPPGTVPGYKECPSVFGKRQSDVYDAVYGDFWTLATVRINRHYLLSGVLIANKYYVPWIK